MRRIDAFLTLALSTALILALGGTCGTSEEDISDTGKPPGAEVAPPYDWNPTDEWTPPYDGTPPDDEILLDEWTPPDD